MNTARYAATTVIVSMLSSFAFAMGHDVVNNDTFGLNIGGRAQLIGYAENVADPYRDNNRLFLFLKQARLNFHGHIDKYLYNTEWAFAAEDINGSNTSLTLLDFAFDLPLLGLEKTWVKVGQFKVPYGRERIANAGALQFAERSLLNQGFTMGRDVGVAVHTAPQGYNATFAVMTGGGRDVPQRFLPETLGFPLVVARAGYNDGVDKDVYTTEQNDLDITRTQRSAHLNALYMKDTLIGHNTVLGVKTAEKSLLLNSNWNQFVGRSPLVRGDFWQAGWDAVWRAPLSANKSLSSEVEMDFGEHSNRYGTTKLAGARVQSGLLVNKKWEMSLRYSGLLPDDAFAKSNVAITGKTIMSEFVPALTYYMKGHDFKVILDAPVLLNAPIAVETSPSRLGAYVLTEQPDQTTAIVPPTTPASTGGYLDRQTVTQARLMIQLAF